MPATPFIGNIILFGGNFPPRGWATCNGQLLAIAQNSALFALIGTTYGGDGQTTFALPDLQSRVALHMGQGPGLSSYVIGQTSGEEGHTVFTSELPAHTHTLGSSTAASALSPATNAPAAASKSLYGAAAATPMAAGTIGNAGGNQSHNNVQPYLAVNFCIALEGVFPPRN